MSHVHLQFKFTPKRRYDGLFYFIVIVFMVVMVYIIIRVPLVVKETSHHLKRLQWDAPHGTPCCKSFSTQLLADYISRDMSAFCKLDCRYRNHPCVYTNITDDLIRRPVYPGGITLEHPLQGCDGELVYILNGRATTVQ